MLRNRRVIRRLTATADGIYYKHSNHLNNWPLSEITERSGFKRARPSSPLRISYRRSTYNQQKAQRIRMYLIKDCWIDWGVRLTVEISYDVHIVYTRVWVIARENRGTTDQAMAVMAWLSNGWVSGNHYNTHSLHNLKSCLT